MFRQVLGLTTSLRQEQRLYTTSRKAYIREALKAFKKVTIQGRVYYTCNVARLNACNRLGDAKQVKMWRTHFFLRSTHFAQVHGVIFNSAPGKELADFSAGAVDRIYVIVRPREIIDPKNGDSIHLEEDLVFASADEDAAE